LQLFVRTLIEAGGPTDGFLITLPKVTSAEQVDAFVFALGRVEESVSGRHRPFFSVHLLDSWSDGSHTIVNWK
jgi:hypothetical protein